MNHSIGGTVLVTGSSGYLGRALVARLATRYAVVSLSRSDRLERWREFCIDGVAVVHLAAPVTVVDDAATLAALAVTDRLFDALPARPVRFIFAGSMSIFATPDDPSTLNESSLLLTAEELRSDPYARTKRLQEDLVRNRCAARGDFLTVLRPVNVWDADRPCEYVVGPRIGPLWLAVGPQRALRLAHLDNVVSAFLAAVKRDSPERYRAFNLDDGARIKPQAFARLVARTNDRPALVVPVPRIVFDIVMRLAHVFWRALRSGRREPRLLLQKQRASRFGAYAVDSTAACDRLDWHADLTPYEISPNS